MSSRAQEGASQGSRAEHVEIHSGPDDRGRYSYTLYWMADYHPGHPDGEYGWRERGQCFFGPLPARFRDSHKLLCWHCPACGHHDATVQPEYGLGDSEPCVHCDNGTARVMTLADAARIEVLQPVPHASEGA